MRDPDLFVYWFKDDLTNCLARIISIQAFVRARDYIQGVSKKSRQILNRSLFREALQCTNIFIKVDCFGTYNVE